MIRTFAILHQGALGDFLLALPALEGLHRLHPEVRFDFLAKPENTAILAEKPYLGRTISQYSTILSPFYQEESWREAELPPCLQGADATFIFGQDSSRVLAERFSRLGMESVHWIRSFPTPEVRQPVTSFIIDQFRRTGWPLEDRPLSITPSQENLRAARELLGRMGLSRRPVLIHPGSGGQRKVRPLKDWLSLIHHIVKNHDLPLMMTLGPADGFLAEFAAHVKGMGIPVLTSPSLDFMAALLSESAFYIGNDSGVSHLAAAVGLPSLIFFGPTDPVVWAPRGPGIHILQEDWAAGENLSWSATEPPRPLAARTVLALQAVTDLSRKTDDF